MALDLSIKKAARIVGSQRLLAEKLGVAEQTISDIKHGRKPCGMDLRIAIAKLAKEDPLYAILDFFIDSLDDQDNDQVTAKKALQAMLAAFPQT